jgi:hypothetical protein
MDERPRPALVLNERRTPGALAPAAGAAQRPERTQFRSPCCPTVPLTRAASSATRRLYTGSAGPGFTRVTPAPAATPSRRAALRCS